MLSIIIPARNESDNLQDILNYFINGMETINYEVILINDLSDDNTLEQAKEIFQNHKNFKIYNNNKILYWVFLDTNRISDYNVFLNLLPDNRSIGDPKPKSIIQIIVNAKKRARFNIKFLPINSSILAWINL